MSLKEAGNCFRGEAEVQMEGPRVELSLGEDWVLNIALAGVGAQGLQFLRIISHSRQGGFVRVQPGRQGNPSPTALFYIYISKL